MTNKVAEKLNKYIFLLELFKKHCKSKSCSEKYKKLVSYLDKETLQFLAECIRNILSPDNIACLPEKIENN